MGIEIGGVSAPQEASIRKSLDELANAIGGLETRVENHLSEKTEPYRKVFPTIKCDVDDTKSVGKAPEIVSETRSIIDNLTRKVRFIESTIGQLASTIE